MQNAVRYRIYTEDKNREWIIEYLSKQFNGFTLIPTVGYWKGSKEQSLIIEVVVTAPVDCMEDLRGIAVRIKYHNQQESVMITNEKIELQFIGD